MPVLMVRNNQKGPTVLASDPKGTNQITWEGQGDPMGNDVQMVPEVLRESPAFVRAVSKGILAIEEDESDPEVLDALARQRAAWDTRQERQTQVAASHLDQVANNDIVPVQCVGPGARGSQCENFVPVKDKDKNAKPPLCTQHADLVMQFVPEDIQANGRTERRWVRATLGDRMRGED